MKSGVYCKQTTIGKSFTYPKRFWCNEMGSAIYDKELGLKVAGNNKFARFNMLVLL